ncbi:MAG TPA: methyltransferase domain-containing protein [Ktedonobacteraceae bacterium]|nr:methyltransferase domain-containing protein [Ktedonobacteraceae bacterium]
MPDTPHSDANTQKTQVQDYFSRTAESYVASFSHKTGDDLKRLLELGEWNAEQQALDIATGGGHTALAVAPLVAQVTASDLTPRMLEKAREFLLSQGVTNAQFQVADAEHLPFADATFDRVTCRIAAHHFPNMLQAVQEVARVLKTGGLFLLIDCMAPSDPELDRFDNTVEKWRDSSHGRSCTKEEWQDFFAQAGLQVEHMELLRKTHDYDDWTRRSQLPADEKAGLERFILESDPRIQSYFEVVRKADGHLDSFSNDFILLKGRKAHPGYP